MKTIFLTLCMITGLALSPGLLSQPVTQDFETGDRNGQSALCWSFPGTSFINTSERITGNWSGRTGQLTSLTSWNGVVSPWLQLSPGTLTFNHKLNLTTWTTRILTVEMLSYPDSLVTTLYTFSFTQPGTSVQVVSIPIGVSGIYKIYIKYTGTGGTARAVIDDIVYPGVYYSEPPACTPLNPIVDTDSDGVPDSEDQYPTDPFRAYNNFLPASGSWSTLMFEDLWPAVGDYDFNDMVVDYKLNRVSNAQNKVVEVIGNFKLRASGASFHNGFGFQFDSLSPNRVISVTGSNLMESSIISLDPSGMEAGQSTATMIVFDDIYHIMGYPGGGTGINTVPGAPYVEPVTLTITMTLIANGTPAAGGTTTLDEVSLTLFNPFLITNQERGREVHLPDKSPTNLVNTAYFDTDQDDSDPGTGRYYKTVNNLPWGLQIVEDIPYMKEQADITTGYLHLGEWAISNGAMYPDWYENESGYRNNSTIFQTPIK